MSNLIFLLTSVSLRQIAPWSTPGLEEDHQVLRQLLLSDKQEPSKLHEAPRSQEDRCS